MNLIKKTSLACCCLITLWGCKKDEQKPADTLSYKLDGVTKNTDAYVFVDDNGVSSIEGRKNPDVLTIYFNTPFAVGTFPIATFHDAVGGEYFIDMDNPVFFHSDSGTLVITSLTKNHISGTFNFRAANGQVTKNITEGKFSSSINYGGEPTDTTEYINSNRVLARRRILMSKLTLGQ